MKRVKIGLIVALGLLGAMPVYAQNGGAPVNATQQSETAKNSSPLSLEQLTESLSLTAAQQEKLGPIITKEFQNMSSVLANSQLTIEQKRSQRDKLILAFPEKVSKHLTEEQRQKLDEIIKRLLAEVQKADKADGGEEGNESSEGDGEYGSRESFQNRISQALVSGLGLSGDQQSNIDPIVADALNSAMILLHNNQLSTGEKWERGQIIVDRAVRRMNNFLSPDQQADLNQMAQDMMDQYRPQ